MTEYHCPNCDGTIEVPEQSSTVVCPYCNTTIQIKTGKILKEHYLMRPQFTIDNIHEKLFSWALKQLGTPKTLETEAKIIETKLVFWPFWVIEIEAVSDYIGNQKKPIFGDGDDAPWLGIANVEETGHLEMEQDIIIPASLNMPKSLAKYMIATKRKEYYDNDVILELNGELRPTIFDYDTSVSKAQERMNSILHEAIFKEVTVITGIDTQMKIPAVFLIHIPIWHIKYEYSAHEYNALMDSASGRVICMQFPRKLTFRAMALFGGIMHLLVGGAIGLLLVYMGLFQGDGWYPTVFRVVFSLGLIAFSSRFFVAAVSLEAGGELID